MSNQLAGLPLDYLIAQDSSDGTPGRITEVGYDAQAIPKRGIGVLYINCRDEHNTGLFGPYLPADDISQQYNEPAPVFDSHGFWANFNAQVDKAVLLGARYVEIDNLDTYDVVSSIKMFDALKGMNVLVKNAAIVDGDQTALFRHQAAIGCIVEKDCGTPATYAGLRTSAGKPDLPIWFVSFGGGRYWAQQMAAQITAAGYRNMGVTYSADGEYGSSEDILLPTPSPSAIPVPPTPPPPAPTAPMTTGADIIAKARSYIGELEDGPDVPRIAAEIGRVFPDLASYCKEADASTPWCGIFVAYVLSQFGIRPAPVAAGVGFMWVDTWVKWGLNIPKGQELPGDVAVFLGNPHHVTFVAGGGRYVGGNQGDSVTETSFRTPDYIRRLSAAATQPVPVSPLPLPGPSRFDRCIPLLLESEGGNDDDPRDPGGRTSRGILQSEWDKYRQTHPGLPSDVWDAPQADVLAIYKQNYWDALLADELPAGVDYAVFDYGVNSGISRAAKALQSFVATDVDGEVGPDTIAAAAKADPATLIGQISDQRLNFLQGLSTWPTFGRGWTSRVQRVRADSLDMAQGAPTPVPTPIPTPVPTPQPVPGPINPDLEQALQEVVNALRPILEKYMAPKAAEPAPPAATSTSQIDLSGVVNLIQQLPQIIAAIQQIITVMQQLAPILGLFGIKLPTVTAVPDAPASRPMGPVVVGAAGAGGVGALIGALLTAFLKQPPAQ